MTRSIGVAAVLFGSLAIVSAQTPSSSQPASSGQTPQRRVASVNTQPRVDVREMPRPIDMHDSVWIENLTMLEVRDLIRRRQDHGARA